MRVAIIGGSAGLGLCLTENLLNKGMDVLVTIRSTNTDTDRLLASYSEQLSYEIADITDEDAMIQVANSLSDKSFDAVVVTAGIIAESDRDLTLDQVNVDDLIQTFMVNTVGPILTAKYLTPKIRDGGKLFIITSEGVGVSTVGTWIPSYGLSKTAATKAAGILNASVNRIDYYAVHPGRMNTKMGRTTAQIEPSESAEGIARMICDEIKISRENWYIDYLGKDMSKQAT